MGRYPEEGAARDEPAGPLAGGDMAGELAALQERTRVLQEQKEEAERGLELQRLQERLEVCCLCSPCS